MKTTIFSFSSLVCLMCSCTFGPNVCDCEKNYKHQATPKFDEKLSKRCSEYVENLSDSKREKWAKDWKVCSSIKSEEEIEKENAEKIKRDAYNSLDYLYGNWVCVVNGFRMNICFFSNGKFYWEDDLSGSSSGTWTGNNSRLLLYDRGINNGNGYIDDIDRNLYLTISNHIFIFEKR